MPSIYILDASGFLYRSYFAIARMTNKKGESTNALFGYIRAIFKLIKEKSPHYIVSVFDGPGNAESREKLYKDYKAHRQKMPEDLLPQILAAQDFCKEFGLPMLSLSGVEADDTMGSVAKFAKSKGVETYLCTSDKDMCQLVDDQTFILQVHKDNFVMGEAQVQEQFGVPPKLIVDFLSLTGDSSDNVPGVSGMGPKTAASLLNQFGSLDALLAHPEKVPGKKGETLKNEKDQALLSRELVTLNLDLPVPQELSFYEKKPSHKEKLKEFLVEKNFNSFLKELDSELSDTQSASKPQADYHLINDENELDRVLKSLSKHSQICLDTETNDIRAMQASLVGVGLGVKEGESFYIPFNGAISEAVLKAKLKPFFASDECAFFGHNIKYDLHVLENAGLPVKNICFDTMLASYLLNSSSRQHSLDALSLAIFQKVKIPIEELIGKGRQEITMDQVQLEKISEYCCEDVDYTIRLKNLFEKELKERGLDKLFFSLELPLLTVLKEMEKEGIYLDLKVLKANGDFIVKEIKEIKDKIYKSAGVEFNLNSTEQLAEVLITKFGVKLTKKTAKTGKFALDADVLDSIKDQHVIINDLLRYRTLEKLRSTYLESLEKDINPKTRRVHCTFNQFVAATGRLSCQDPNLQNIPIRTEEGKKIREAFCPEKSNWSFIGADYSQIELRLLAHLSEDKVLIEAFKHGEDIHQATAAAIFDQPLALVTKDQRQYAKVVNFGVIYGQQAYGLAKELSITPKKAQAFIDMYFAKYKRVKEYIEECKAFSAKSGKAVTFTGRERLIPEMHSKNFSIKTAAERLAINTPLQGSAADLIKKAMLDIQAMLKKEHFLTKMILQIHDELIFEVPDDEIESVLPKIKECMEHVMELKVPLVVDIGIGKNWKEC